MRRSAWDLLERRGIVALTGFAGAFGLAVSAVIVVTMSWSAGAPARASSTSQAESEVTWLLVGFQGRTDTFVVELHGEERISTARSILQQPVEERQSIMGRIVKEPRIYNPGWSYHLDPDTISFFDLAIEVCDSNPRYVEEHLDEVCGELLPGCDWCPWSSYPLALITNPAHTAHLPLLARLSRLRIPDVEMVPDLSDSDPASDPFDFVSAEIDGRVLTTVVRYAGGDQDHGFTLHASSSFMESYPLQTRARLQHDAHGDMGRAHITETLRFDLGPLEETYRTAYPGDDGGVLLRLEGWDGRLHLAP